MAPANHTLGEENSTPFAPVQRLPTKTSIQAVLELV